MRLLLVFKLILAFAPIIVAVPLEQSDEENDLPDLLGAGSSELFSSSSSFPAVTTSSDDLDNDNMFLEEDPSEGKELFHRDSLSLLLFLSLICSIMFEIYILEKEDLQYNFCFCDKSHVIYLFITDHQDNNNNNSLSDSTTDDLSFYPLVEDAASDFPPDVADVALADTNDGGGGGGGGFIISPCQDQDSSTSSTSSASDIFSSSSLANYPNTFLKLKARDWAGDILNFLRGGVAPNNPNNNNNGAPKACPNPFTTSGSGSGGGSNTPETSNNNKNENDDQRPPTQQPPPPPPATFLPEIETREDEELCPKKGPDGTINHIPLCCYSNKNLEGSFVYKFMCYRRSLSISLFFTFFFLTLSIRYHDVQYCMLPDFIKLFMFCFFEKKEKKFSCVDRERSHIT